MGIHGISSNERTQHSAISAIVPFYNKKPSSLSTRDGELLDPAELDEDGVENVTKEEPHKDNENNYSDDRENKRVGARHG